MNRLTKGVLATAAVAVSLVATACGGVSGGEGGQFRYMVPNAAGSGWDNTARTAAKIMEEDKIADRIDVFNVDGANGTVGLSRLVADDGNGALVMQMGYGLVAATVSQSSSTTFADTTPVAKLLDEYLAVVVPADSPFNNLDDLLAGWKANPRLNAGGGSAIGGADHVATLLMADANGIARTDVNYVSFSGGLLPAVLGGQVDFAVTSAADAVEQIEAGKLKAIAVTGERRFDALPDVPTLTESGTDVVVANWRGVVAPPGLDEQETQNLIDTFTALHESQGWKDAVERNGWVDAFVTGDEFGTYLDQQAVQIRAALDGLEQ
ncbi:tripartite tricarboxylate transporter substrate binding protein [Rhodococcus sp. T2V]|uniref:Bug family tripartite tricarboxylate transporter substrate binding protein n=1 Tax=Rhodococcus sp. T2V TaxID=3034164 RepID=UPI0023E33228|nr:tripartite tricarboxylate transporter substrate binding protein [Rhodococcus sp. T2V]MDF3307923.1 tripartite tricarboxylate transporter substrate binding protein [Rhodococcus sp. T2V]